MTKHKDNKSDKANIEYWTLNILLNISKIILFLWILHD